MILSIDPGKRIGYALFTPTGEDVERGVIDFDDWFKPGPGGDPWLDSEGVVFRGWSIRQFVVEGFRHDPDVKQGGSLHWASQIEGAVKMLGAVTYTPVAVQYSSILPVAMLHAGYEPPVTRTGKKKHLPDEDSAWLHGRYWLTGQGGGSGLDVEIRRQEHG